MAGKSRFTPRVRIRIEGKGLFFGPGPAQLLRHIDTWGSVRSACQRMGLSYSKGRSILRRLDQELGFSLVRRSKGGAGGGNACLTPAGKRLLALYAAYEETVCACARQQFAPVEQFLLGGTTDAEELP